jgi:hypothetical protein
MHLAGLMGKVGTYLTYRSKESLLAMLAPWAFNYSGRRDKRTSCCPPNVLF